MPTILEILGWRLFFYSNENDEPIHIHARKAGMECKYWIDIKEFDIKEAYSFGLRIKIKDKFVELFLIILIILSISGMNLRGENK